MCWKTVQCRVPQNQIKDRHQNDTKGRIPFSNPVLQQGQGGREDRNGNLAGLPHSELFRSKT